MTQATSLSKESHVTPRTFNEYRGPDGSLEREPLEDSRLRLARLRCPPNRGRYDRHHQADQGGGRQPRPVPQGGSDPQKRLPAGGSPDRARRRAERDEDG